jgi:hypothetical protein
MDADRIAAAKWKFRSQMRDNVTRCVGGSVDIARGYSSKNEPWCRAGLASGAWRRFQSAVSLAVIHPGAVSGLTSNGGSLSTGTQNVNTFSGALRRWSAWRRKSPGVTAVDLD